MSKPTEKPAEAEGNPGKKRTIIIILIALIAIGAGAGGTWYFMKNSGGAAEPEQPKEKPITFINLDTFTVNLQPEENGQYLQVGLTIKARESNVGAMITKQMPEIRNRILLLLSSKKAAELGPKLGKEQLGLEILREIRQSLDTEEMKKDVIEVLFTSFVIQ